MLARFSEAFLVLRAMQCGLPMAWTPLVLVGMNLVYLLAAYPLGKLSDSMPHGRLLGAGLLLLVASDLLLAYGSGWPWVVAGVALWGLHMGMTQGPLSRMVADAAPDDLRGTAYGSSAWPAVWRCCWQVSSPAGYGIASAPAPRSSPGPSSARSHLRCSACAHGRCGSMRAA